MLQRSRFSLEKSRLFAVKRRVIKRHLLCLALSRIVEWPWPAKFVALSVFFCKSNRPITTQFAIQSPSCQIFQPVFGFLCRSELTLLPVFIKSGFVFRHIEPFTNLLKKPLFAFAKVEG